MPDISVPAASITALVIGGEWLNVHSVTVAFASFTAGAGGSSTYAVGPYVQATIQGGPHNGNRVVAPLSSVAALRLAP